MNRLLVLSLTGASCQPDVRIPLITNQYGRHFANISIPTINVHNRSVQITSGEHIMTASPDGMMDDDFVLREVEIQSSSGRIRYVGPSLMMSSDDDYSYIGVGPSSELTRSVGSVAIVRTGPNSADLILNSTTENFFSNCSPNTTVSFDLVENQYMDVEFEIEGGRMSRGRIRLGPTDSAIPHVPFLIFNDLIEAIIANGAIANGFRNMRALFTNCTDEIKALLPVVRMNLLGREGEALIGTIVYYPEDYLEFDNGRCTIMTVGVTAEVHRASFDPIMIPESNVRISDNNVYEICDAQY